LRSVELDMPRVRISIRLFLVWYLSSWAGLQILIAGILLIHGMAPHRILPTLPRILRFTAGIPLTWIVLLTPYLLFVLTRPLVRTYRAAEFLLLVKALTLQGILPLRLLFGGYKFLDPAENIIARGFARVSDGGPSQ